MSDRTRCAPTITALVPLVMMGGGLGLLIPGAVSASPGSAVTPALQTCTSGLIGDVTGDGEVGLGDAQQILRHAVGLSVDPTIESRMPTHGDVNGDGDTGLGDAQQVLRWWTGLDVEYPIGSPCGTGGDGTLTAQNSTSGSNIPSSFTLTLDGSVQLEMPANGEVEQGIDIGSHELVLTLPGNCTTGGSLTRAITTTSEFPNWSVNWVIECS